MTGKRLFDIVFSLSLLLLFLPFGLLIALGIFLCSPGAIFYTQIRLGRAGKPFKCYKFRTMHLQADRRLKELLLTDPALQTEWKRHQKLKSDPRVFFFGRLLRKTSIDELPQFWNVLKGELSVVGPRPYMVNQRKELGSLAEKILSIRPGVTGLWQTSGRSNTTFDKRIALDAAYVDRSAFLYDLWLILKTIPEILLLRNAC
ncbi:MAG: UDP-glucose:undecaprenyl-phosphate glucose-1-phosphate transferase [Chlamydiales bacterium]|nr:UDP-glucose:undecaprenyl-phosphate glucose-1-phosphate transferase [Chlamydiales bacterium]